MAQVFTSVESKKLLALIDKSIKDKDLTEKGIESLILIKAKIVGNLIPDRQEFIYNFTNGGWNSEFAANKAQAYKQAIERWGDGSDLANRVDKTSFRGSTPRDYSNEMSKFY